jgi:hypothetical protein
MKKRILLILAMASVYVWIRRLQRSVVADHTAADKAESGWAGEGGANPAPSV